MTTRTLKDYVIHIGSCARFEWVRSGLSNGGCDGPWTPKPCDCGLDALLAVSSEPEQEKVMRAPTTEAETVADPRDGESDDAWQELSDAIEAGQRPAATSPRPVVDLIDALIVASALTERSRLLADGNQPTGCEASGNNRGSDSAEKQTPELPAEPQTPAVVPAGETPEHREVPHQADDLLKGSEPASRPAPKPEALLKEADDWDFHQACELAASSLDLIRRQSAALRALIADLATTEAEAFKAGLETERVYAGEGGWEWFHQPSGRISKTPNEALAAYREQKGRVK